MARRAEAEPVYEAADLFRRRCLIEGRSFLWPERYVWTPETISALRDAFIGNPDTGTGTFFEKWRDQLADQPEEVHLVATDTVAFYYLHPGNIGRERKLAGVEKVIGWKLEQQQPELELLEKAYSAKVGHAGTLYNTRRPEQVDFYLQFFGEVLSSDIDPTDADACKRLADSVRERVPQSGPARHILLHLLFPEYFERIASDRYKQKIVEAFADRAGRASDRDDALLNIRHALVEEYGREDLDFYEDGIREIWHEGPPPPPPAEQETNKVDHEGGNLQPSRHVPLNVILYGPPGAGKTYLTQRRALEILDQDSANLPDEDIGEHFRKHLSEGRIEFITFHPSYSYEEFVEGFRYDKDEKVPTLHDGVFKRLVERASSYSQELARENARIWKVSLGDHRAPRLFDRCIQNGEIAIGWFKDRDLSRYGKNDIAGLFGNEKNNARSVNYFVNEMREGDYVAVFKNQREIRAIGVVAGVYQHKWYEYGEDHPHTRRVEWLDQREHDIYQINGSKYMVQPTVYLLDDISPDEFAKLLPDDGSSQEPHVLIIDEINRGNLSRIFGELITLIEEDKRRGERNELTARLPYSREPFTVPSNIYVIGTMNTADRSIALIDTALRRRFEFEEMRPDAGVIRKILKAGGCADEHVDLVCGVFETINKRVAVLLDRDHQVGHSYLLGATSVEDLRHALYRKIFPLLQEYFYNDPERLREVLGAYEAENRKGFVRRIEEYGSAFEDAVPDEDLPWEFVEYPAEVEFEEALQNTFFVSGNG